MDKLINDLVSAIKVNNFEKSVELIVIDDYSDIPIVINDTPFPVTLERNSKNSGAPHSRKKGFNLSQGRFVHFHDSDDNISENWLLDIINELKNNSQIDLLMTARYDHDDKGKKYTLQRYFHKKVENIEKVKSRLVYRNCMGPLGGVTFSRRVLEQVKFKPLSSCQDWQMYIDAIKSAKVLSSCPDTHFIFNKAGDDRISGDPRKKILGHLQLAKITSKESTFGKNIRLFYLQTCRQHIYNQGGGILKFYKKNKFKILMNYLLISVYWRIN